MVYWGEYSCYAARRRLAHVLERVVRREGPENRDQTALLVELVRRSGVSMPGDPFHRQAPSLWT